jgi:hypothetical protein
MVRWVSAGIGVFVVVGIATFLSGYFSRYTGAGIASDKKTSALEERLARNSSRESVVASGVETAPLQVKEESDAAVLDQVQEQSAESIRNEKPPPPQDDIVRDPALIEQARDLFENGPFEPEPPETHGPVKLLKSVFANERANRSAKKVERAIYSLAGTDLIPKKLLRSVHCHSTVCKISITWSNKYPFAHLAVGGQVAIQQQTNVIALEPMSEADRDGNVMIDIYFARTGNTLAEIESRVAKL